MKLSFELDKDDASFSAWPVLNSRDKKFELSKS